MWRQLIKSFVITVTVILVGGLTVSKLLKIGGYGYTSSQTGAPGAKQAAQARRGLIHFGWTPQAADAVIQLNKEWFALLEKEHPVDRSLQLTLLEGLGKHKGLMDFLAGQPETAGLLAIADDPVSLVNLFESAGENAECIINLFALHAAPQDAAMLEEALNNNSDLICRLLDRGLIGSEAAFIFERESEAGAAYEHWLHEVLGVKLDGTDKELASVVNLVLKYGPGIRMRMKDSQEFTARFRLEIWPKLVRIAGASGNMFEMYLDDPRIWDLLALDQGEELLRDRGLLLPIDLLYGYQELGRSPFPEQLHGALIQTLLHGDDRTIKALLKFRDEPLFHALLERPLPAGTMAAALNKLFEAGPGYPELLRQYDKISDKGLRDEVGPPPNILKVWAPLYYTAWEVPKKLLQGRDPTGADWFQSLADPVSFVVPLLKVGTMTVSMGKSLAGINRNEPAGSSLAEAGLEVAEQQLGEEVARKLSESELLKFSITARLTQMQASYRGAVKENTTVGITKPVRFMFGYGGVGRKTLRSLSSLDARLFMRHDTKMVINFGNQAAGENTSRFMNETAAHFIAAANADSQSSSAVGTLPPDASHVDAWRRNVAAWWLMHASGMVDGPSTSSTETAWN